jgi:hypothetical protein
MKYRKKPVVIEALQWFPPGDERHDPSLLSDRKGNRVDPPDYRQRGDIYCFAPGMSKGYGGDIYLICMEKNGDSIRLEPGDWICTQEVNGKLDKWPVKPDIFAATYEPAE